MPKIILIPPIVFIVSGAQFVCAGGRGAHKGRCSLLHLDRFVPAECVTLEGHLFIARSSVRRSVCIILAVERAPHNGSVCSLLRWGSERKRVLLPAAAAAAPNESRGLDETGSGWSTCAIPSLFYFIHFFFPVIYLMKEESKVDSAEARLMNKIRCGTPLAHSFARASGVVSQPIFASSLQCWHAHEAPMPLDRGVATSP